MNAKRDKICHFYKVILRALDKIVLNHKKARDFQLRNSSFLIVIISSSRSVMCALKVISLGIGISGRNVIMWVQKDLMKPQLGNIFKVKEAGQKVFKIKKRIISGVEKPWYYAFYCGKIYFICSWNWVFAQPLHEYKIWERVKHDIALDKLSVKEYEDPFRDSGK